MKKFENLYFKKASKYLALHRRSYYKTQEGTFGFYQSTVVHWHSSSEFVKTVFATVFSNLELLPSNFNSFNCLRLLSANVDLNVLHIKCIKHYTYFLVCNRYYFSTIILQVCFMFLRYSYKWSKTSERNLLKYFELWNVSRFPHPHIIC